MKITSLTLLFLLNYACLAAQSDTAFIKFLINKIRGLQPTGTIYYADVPYPKTFKHRVQHIKPGIYPGFKNGTVSESLKLTAKESRYIQDEHKKNLHKPFPDSLFENSCRIRSDSIIPFVDKLNLQIMDSVIKLSNPSGTNVWQLGLMRWSFLFSRPIYLRNKTILVHYFMNYTLSSGENSFRFYKWNNNNWERWGVISGGAW